MVLLKQRSLTFLVMLVLLSAGCAVLRMERDTSFRFSHQQHQQVKNCAACHKSTDDGIGMPQLKTCMVCHKNVDTEKPPERKVESLFVDDVFQAQHTQRLSEEIIFSHQSHSDQHKVACADCHLGISENSNVRSLKPINMQACADCHRDRAQEPAVAKGIDSCAVCHRSLGKETQPASHKQNWTQFHGQKAKDGIGEGMDQCSLCHTEQSCDSCHQSQAPQNHTPFWAQRGHGVAAAMDRESCATCHQEDTCTSCHSSTAPRSHTAQWGESRNTHCQSCHFPVAEESCTLCHQQGTPSHATATPNPHVDATLDCRSCHGGGTGAAPMPHVDDGSSCVYCHH